MTPATPRPRTSGRGFAAVAVSAAVGGAVCGAVAVAAFTWWVPPGRLLRRVALAFRPLKGRGGHSDSEILRRIAPPLDFSLHKGQGGRIGVVGGSGDYTGAPYYAAMAALKSGSELAYVFTSVEAQLPIKSYSPELMVTPIFDGRQTSSDEKWAGEILKKMEEKLKRLHALVVGPGLGRNKTLVPLFDRILEVATAKNIVTVIDADGLWMLTQSLRLPEHRKGKIVLTPNVVEFQRLWEAFLGTEKLSDDPLEDTRRLSAKLGVIIAQKGKRDIISDGEDVVCCDERGAPRRPGGLGDVLSGVISTFVAWESIAQNRPASDNNDDEYKHDTKLLLNAVKCACTVVRRGWAWTFEKYQRASGAPDLLNELGRVMHNMELGGRVKHFD